MVDFADKVVLITGAAGGIGQVLCRHFGGLGARIGAIDKSDSLPAWVESLRGEGFEVAGRVANTADESATQEAVAAVSGDLGPVDVLINNAGFSLRPTLRASTADSWRREIEGNLGGTYHCTAAVLPGMQERGRGAIVCISSVNGLTTLGHPGYSAAKAGVISFTKSLAVEYGRYGIRANVICPGTVRTPVWTDRVRRKPEIFESLVKWYPLRRVVEPTDLAKAAAFLASDDASAITGVVLPVDCGLMAGNIVMSSELTLEEY